MTARLGRPEAVWWAQADSEAASPAPSLRGVIEADVAIVGGGYVGLWTAIELKRRDPSCRVALLERSVCGAGASGRNNGFALSWWSKIATLEKLVGREHALWLGHASAAAVDELETFLAEERINASYRRSGWLWTATSKAQLGTWTSTIRDCERLGVSPFIELSRVDVNALVPSPRHLGGVLDPQAATLHPGRLVRGLRQVAIRLGVQLFEHSPVRRVKSELPSLVKTDHGEVRAEQVVIATNAWAAGWPSLRRLIVGIATDGIATEPIPERLSEMGWSDGPGVTDSRQMIHVYRTTPDQRISFGSGGRGVAFGGRIGRRFRASTKHAPGTVAEFHRIFPSLRDVQIAYHWSAVIDRSPTGLPRFGRFGKRENLLYGIGWSGNGVAPSLIGGRILASMALGQDNEWASSRLIDAVQGTFPPEPIRYLGAQVIRRAVEAKEVAEDDGRSPSRWVRALTGLAPGSIVPTDK